jgi:hypothetical protein
VNICFQAVNPGPEEESKRQLTEQRPLVEKGSPFKKSIFEGFARLVKSEDVLGELDDGAEEQERQSDAGWNLSPDGILLPFESVLKLVVHDDDPSAVSKEDGSEEDEQAAVEDVRVSYRAILPYLLVDRVAPKPPVFHFPFVLSVEIFIWIAFF